MPRIVLGIYVTKVQIAPKSLIALRTSATPTPSISSALIHIHLSHRSADYKHLNVHGISAIKVIIRAFRIVQNLIVLQIRIKSNVLSHQLINVMGMLKTALTRYAMKEIT